MTSCLPPCLHGGQILLLSLVDQPNVATGHGLWEARPKQGPDKPRPRKSETRRLARLAGPAGPDWIDGLLDGL